MLIPKLSTGTVWRRPDYAMLGAMDKKTYQTLGDAIGMPDDEDKQNIRRIINRYEKKHPGEMKTLIEYAQAHSAAFDNEFGLVSGKGGTGVSSNGVRYLMELPPGLHAKLEMYLPTLFREKKHFQWFVKNFPELLIPEKY